MLWTVTTVYVSVIYYLVSAFCVLNSFIAKHSTF